MENTPPAEFKNNKKPIVIISLLLILIILIILIIITLFNTNKSINENDINITPKADKDNLTEEIDLPYYFIAVHNEPFHDEMNSEGKIAQSYNILRRMVERADEYDIKLTLMFTAQWAEYINSDPSLINEVRSWEDNGHEIAGHHHSEYHGGWDGYSAFTEEESARIRLVKTGEVETFLGDLDDYIISLKKINPSINSGCMNDEQDKRVMPDEIIYDTCSGFFNYGEVGLRRADGLDANVGINEYILKGNVNNIDRYWLSHYIIGSEIKARDAFNILSEMDEDQVYGSIVHSNEEQELALYSLLDLLHEIDEKGIKSRTLAEIIENEMLPIEELDEELLNTTFDTGSSKPDTILPKGLCGDGICNELETNNPSLCPEDCN